MAFLTQIIRWAVGANSFAHGRINPPLQFWLRLIRFKPNAVHLTVRGELVEPPASQLEPFDKAFSPERSRRVRANGNFSKVNSIVFKSAMRLLCGALLLLALAPAHAAPTEYELKAAFIYQIARFVEWPSSPEQFASGPLRLCVLGNSPFGSALDTIRGKPVNERKMEVSLLDKDADIRECNIIFIAAPAEKHIERIAALSRGAGMLTIGDTQGFAQRGTMVNFFLESGKIRFEINLEASQRAGLKISSQLLKLARIVREETP
jgi:hypothetical protein